MDHRNWPKREGSIWKFPQSFSVRVRIPHSCIPFNMHSPISQSPFHSSTFNLPLSLHDTIHGLHNEVLPMRFAYQWRWLPMRLHDACRDLFWCVDWLALARADGKAISSLAGFVRTFSSWHHLGWLFLLSSAVSRDSDEMNGLLLFFWPVNYFIIPGSTVNQKHFIISIT